MTQNHGPETQFSQELHSTKYRHEGETFDDYCIRYSRTVCNSEEDFRTLLSSLREQRLLPAGRQQLSVGRPYETTAFNCFVGDNIHDSMSGIMDACSRGANVLRTGGGMGWDFSTIRPYGEPVRGLGEKAYATGPVSFMNIWNAMCGTILSAGHRRGAMMAVLDVHHPDIMRFINSKQDQETLSNFNISVACTDEFMNAVERDLSYELRFEERPHGKIKASDVWARIMERNWDWGEPGVLFIDTINRMNPLSYCEHISATNPCGEQPLPPNGACLLGSLNMVKYLVPAFEGVRLETPKGGLTTKISRMWDINYNQLARDINSAVRAFDNVIDCTYYPLEEQRIEAQQKRRMGIGVTGMANMLEVRGFSYGSAEYIQKQDAIMEFIRDKSYETSIDLAIEKEPFEKFDSDGWLSSGFASTLPDSIKSRIEQHGLRNGLLLSIAPTGTISLTADNVSSGIEPPYALENERLIHMPQGQVSIAVKDWALENHGVRGKTADEVTGEEHIDVLCAAQKYIDSAVSKTCNVSGQMGGKGPGITYDEFKRLYARAYEKGAKGCTTFNKNGKRFGIFQEIPRTEVEAKEALEEAAACFINPSDGVRTCDF